MAYMICQSFIDRLFKIGLFYWTSKLLFALLGCLLLIKNDSPVEEKRIVLYQYLAKNIIYFYKESLSPNGSWLPFVKNESAVYLINFGLLPTTFVIFLQSVSPQILWHMILFLIFSFQVVSAVNCASRGWINVDIDTIACEACGARLLFSTPASWNQQQGMLFFRVIILEHRSIIWVF